MLIRKLQDIQSITIKKLTNTNNKNHKKINQINLQYVPSSWSMEVTNAQLAKQSMKWTTIKSSREDVSKLRTGGNISKRNPMN